MKTNNLFRFVMGKYWKACYKDIYELAGSVSVLLASIVLLFSYFPLPNPYFPFAFGLTLVWGMILLLQLPSGRRLWYAWWLIAHPPVVRDGQCHVSLDWGVLLTKNIWETRQWVALSDKNHTPVWLAGDTCHLTRSHPAVWGMYHHDLELCRAFRHVGSPNGVPGSPLVYAFLQGNRDCVQDRDPREFAGSYNALVDQRKATLSLFLLPHLIPALSNLVLEYLVHRWCSCERCNPMEDEKNSPMEEKGGKEDFHNQDSVPEPT
jgi:hypothetical protein